MAPNDWESFMASLRQEYLESLDEKIAVVERYEGLDFSLEEISNFFHKLKGSGATYGFNAISEMGETLEDYFKSLLESASDPNLRAKNLDIDELTRATQHLHEARLFLSSIKTFYAKNPLSETFPTAWKSGKNNE